MTTKKELNTRFQATAANKQYQNVQNVLIITFTDTVQYSSAYI